MRDFRKSGLPFPAALLRFALCALGLALATAAHAEDDDADGTDPSASRAYESHVVIHSDLSATFEDRYSVKILREGAIENEAQQELSYRESVDPVELLEAYTQKADGRRVDVDGSNVLIRDAANGMALVYERDAKAISIVYPDVDAGDTVVYRSRRRATKSPFTGHFFRNWLIPRSASYEVFRVTVDFPTGLDLKATVRGPGVTKAVEENGRRLVFTYKPGEWAPEDSGAVSAWDREPAIFVSTFSSYEEVAAGYRALDAGKAVVTPEIKALAETITQGIPERRQQAEAITNWVRKNIRYATVTMGAEGYSPNPAPVILKNRYGDCKDHVVLTSALLAAKGIGSESVVINAGSEYQLPPLPLPRFNHVILYVPEFDLYDDPTSSRTSFGVLPFGSYDKPVLRYSEAGTRLARTPPMTTESNTIEAKTAVLVSADGTISGTTTQTFTGAFATFGRETADKIQRAGRTRHAERVLRRSGTPGRGQFDAADPWDFKDRYTLRSTFTQNDKLETPLTGLRDVPGGMLTYPNPYTWFFWRRLPERKTDFPCYAGKVTEETEVTFAEGLPLPHPLEAAEVATPYFTFRLESAIADRTLKVRCTIASLVKGQVCPSKIEEEIAPAFLKIERSLKQQMAFGSRTTSALANP